MEVKRAILNGVKKDFVYMIRSEADLRHVASSTLHSKVEADLKIDKRMLPYPEKPRVWEMPRPGKAKQEAEKTKVHNRYKSQVSFLCRYVLASRERTIPLK